MACNNVDMFHFPSLAEIRYHIRTLLVLAGKVKV